MKRDERFHLETHEILLSSENIVTNIITEREGTKLEYNIMKPRF